MYTTLHCKNCLFPYRNIYQNSLDTYVIIVFVVQFYTQEREEGLCHRTGVYRRVLAIIQPVNSRVSVCATEDH